MHTRLLRVASFGISSGLLLLALRGTALAVARVPEIDPGTAASGLAILAGAVLFLAERFRRR